MWNELIITNFILIMAIAIVVMASNVIYICKRKKIHIKNITRLQYFDIFWRGIFVGYIVAVFNVTGVFTEKAFGGGGVNLVPFRGIEEMIANMAYRSEYSTGLGIEVDFLVGNVIMFMPLGFLLPLLTKKINKYYKVCVASLLSTLSIEILQILFGTGNLDIDDIIFINFFCK